VVDQSSEQPSRSFDYMVSCSAAERDRGAAKVAAVCYPGALVLSCSDPGCSGSDPAQWKSGAVCAGGQGRQPKGRYEGWRHACFPGIAETKALPARRTGAPSGPKRGRDAARGARALGASPRSLWP